jgi:hypothetical protein
MVFLAILGGFVGIVALVVLSTLLRGYALSVLWGWFMVPTLGLPHLSVAQAIGIAIVVSFLTYQDHSDLQKKEESNGETIARGGCSCGPVSAHRFGHRVGCPPVYVMCRTEFASSHREKLVPP